MTNFHAKDSTGHNFKSKKSLREAVARVRAEDSSGGVFFEDTSLFNNRGVLGWHQLGPTDVIVGPDPYRQRNWYANIKNGKVV